MSVVENIIFGSHFFQPSIMATQLTARLQAPVNKRRGTRTSTQRKAADASARAKRKLLASDIKAIWKTFDSAIEELAIKHSMKSKKMKKLILHLPGNLKGRKISKWNAFQHLTRMESNTGTNLDFEQ